MSSNDTSYLEAHFWCLKKLLQRRGWDLFALSEQAVNINDDQIWALRGNMFCSCSMDGDHMCRWENINIPLQQVVKDKWKFRNSHVEKKPTGPPITGAAVFGIPG